MLRTLLRIVRDESFDDFPYPPKTYNQEKFIEKRLAKDMPYRYGNESSCGPWLWQIPNEIVAHLADIKSKKEISKIAKLWRETFDEYVAESYSLKDTQGLLEDLQSASSEAIRAEKRAYLYCST